MNSGWFVNLRALLEVLYFVAGIVIAVFAGFGLRQISLTKKIATTSAKREALKFAAERCQYYADHCVPADTDLRQQQGPLNLTFLAMRVPFSIVAGEIVITPFNEKLSIPELQRAGAFITNCLNSLEAFAIPFAAGVADDELGYQEAASSFCQLVEQDIIMIVLIRRSGPRYESTMKLYDRWKSRLVAQDLESKMKKMQEQHKTVADKGKIKTAEPY